MNRYIKMALLVLLSTAAISSNAANITKKQAADFIEELEYAVENRDIRGVQSRISDKAILLFTDHKKGKAPKSSTYNKHKYIHSLNNKWNYLQMSKVKTTEKKIKLSEDKQKAIATIKSEGKEIVMASVIKGKGTSIVTIEMIDGKPLVTKSENEFYYD